MLLSHRYRFLFVANLRTASTSIQAALRPVSDVFLGVTAGGKHLSLVEVQERFGAEALARLYKWGVVREPASYLWSLYKFHKQPGFDGQPHSTRGMSFEDFYFADTHGWMRTPQSARFAGPEGVYGLDLAVRFEDLSAGFSYLKLRLGLPNLLLPLTNRSAVGPPRIAPELVGRIREDYAADYAFLERYANRERTADGFVPILRPAPPPEPRPALATGGAGR